MLVCSVENFAKSFQNIPPRMVSMVWCHKRDIVMFGQCQPPPLGLQAFSKIQRQDLPFKSLKLSYSKLS